ncbi:phosphatidylserine decarboxylase [Oceanospirillum multiglobuliferum]|uniref:Phosphatidylserine decarboxylase proenzyme n=1 Tax=Oceanospirillum multiglobuliferum TaxID=64969 RepID=A0A1T4RHQ1_9GAMM|nr:archaetidylserine decarboxylase [Oceanospirillum multiglobuliferum]OPX54779.1 phosphatidylserine decarboxylase [Oceanospirillum multiglobuliferum]SKA15449.1 phosphatidylserine decarboxylase [Oceanospirillum multiglobuliferum]
MNKKQLFAWIQYPLPHHLISRLVGFLAETKIGWLKNKLIGQFIKTFKVDMSEAEQPDAQAYANFNEFFTRPLKAGARPICALENSIACPVDGTVSQLGCIEYGRIFQAKGHSYSVQELLGGDIDRAAPFMGGQFATIYLSPKDYHRIHMPIAGTLRQMIHIPGRLFSVNPATTENVNGLFARNERVAAIFDTEHGPMAMVLVGAMIVASIETVWAGQVTPLSRQVDVTDYPENPQPLRLEKGDELGRFKLGSTIVMLYGVEMASFLDSIAPGTPTRMGEYFGQIGQTTPVEQ